MVTEFSLSPQVSQTGQKYSVVKFKLLGKLNDADAKVAKFFADTMKASASKVPEMSADDYNRAGSESDHDAVEE